MTEFNFDGGDDHENIFDDLLDDLAFETNIGNAADDLGNFEFDEKLLEEIAGGTLEEIGGDDDVGGNVKSAAGGEKQANKFANVPLHSTSSLSVGSNRIEHQQNNQPGPNYSYSNNSVSIPRMELPVVPENGQEHRMQLLAPGRELYYTRPTPSSTNNTGHQLDGNNNSNHQINNSDHNITINTNNASQSGAISSNRPFLDPSMGILNAAIGRGDDGRMLPPEDRLNVEASLPADNSSSSSNKNNDGNKNNDNSSSSLLADDNNSSTSNNKRKKSIGERSISGNGPNYLTQKLNSSINSPHANAGIQPGIQPPQQPPAVRTTQLDTDALIQIPTSLLKAFNGGGIPKVQQLVREITLHNCAMKTPALDQDIYGQQYVSGFFEAVYSAHPDAVWVAKKSKFLSETNQITAKIYFAGTRIASDMLGGGGNIFNNTTNNTGGINNNTFLYKKFGSSLLEEMDISTLSEAEVAAMKELETVGGNLSLFGKGTMTLTVEETTGKISRFCLDWLITSFRRADVWGF